MPKLFESLKSRFSEDKSLKLKILVGLETDFGKVSKQLAEIEFSSEKKQLEHVGQKRYLESIKQSLNSREVDNETVHQQIGFFKKWLIDGRIEILKTKKPNHSKTVYFQV